MSVRWSFSWEDEEWLATRTPPADNNLKLAIETLIVPFGRSWQAVDNYLEVWRNMELEHGAEYSVSTPSAAVERISRDTVEIGDLYDQFEDVRLPVDEFVTLLTDLSAAMRNQ
ncbi:hypothetical protein [Streptomyces sp. NPDC048172]|uniref:hypothetical protein n=1 Tax=Streptomyces sp. NPDC048172 TaxID=3365505 RepID=UPI003714DD79